MIEKFLYHPVQQPNRFKIRDLLITFEGYIFLTAKSYDRLLGPLNLTKTYVVSPVYTSNSEFIYICMNNNVLFDKPSQDGVLSLHFPSLQVIFEAPTRTYDRLLHRNVTTLPQPKLPPIRQPFCGCPGSLQFPKKNV